jgi:hypothetical protein
MLVSFKKRIENLPGRALVVAVGYYGIVYFVYRIYICYKNIS